MKIFCEQKKAEDADEIVGDVECPIPVSNSKVAEPCYIKSEAMDEPAFMIGNRVSQLNGKAGSIFHYDILITSNQRFWFVKLNYHYWLNFF